MKTAMLPDGSPIYFPDTMHDDQMDAAVRAILGVDKIEAEGATQQAATGMMQQMQGIIDALDSLSQIVAQAATKDTQSAVAQQIEGLGHLINQNNDALKQAILAPREVITPDNRRFVSNPKL